MERVNRSSGEYFWGCSAYPKCKKTAPYDDKPISRWAHPRRSDADWMLSDDDLLEAWAEAMTYDCGFK